MNASAVVTAGFILLPLLVSVGFVLAYEWPGRRLGEDAAVRRRRATRLGAEVFAWLLITAIMAATGVLRRVDATPPPFAGLALAVGFLGVVVPLSPVGTLLVRGLPLWFLVGFQVFRFP